MADRNLADLRYRAIQCLGEIGELACNATVAESALQLVTRAVFDLLGDRQAHRRAGAVDRVEEAPPRLPVARGAG